MVTSARVHRESNYVLATIAARIAAYSDALLGWFRIGNDEDTS